MRRSSKTENPGGIGDSPGFGLFVTETPTRQHAADVCLAARNQALGLRHAKIRYNTKIIAKGLGASEIVQGHVMRTKRTQDRV